MEKEKKEILRAWFFNKYPDPNSKERRRWRDGVRMLANLKDDKFIGGERGTSQKAINDFNRWILELRTEMKGE